MYRRADAFVGDVLGRLEPGTAVMIVSDHGFHSFRWSVNLNTWLVEKGYMALQGQAPGEKKLDDLFGGGTFWENVDWSRTRAYAMGLGQIYVNLKGREGRGIVNPGAEYDALMTSIATDLKAMQDPRDGARVVRNVYKRDDIYQGPFFNDAAELQVGFEDGYRTSWQTALGGTPPRLIEPNMKKWSGDHGSYDYAITAGVLISNTKPSTLDASDYRYRADCAEVLWSHDPAGAGRQANLLTPQSPVLMRIARGPGLRSPVSGPRHDGSLSQFLSTRTLQAERD